jgi:ketosteroid isomerase-like protein
MNGILWAALGVAIGTWGLAFAESPNKDVDDLVRRTEEANQALVRGDIDTYVRLTRHAPDYLLMNPFGGKPSHGFADSPERRAGMKKFFKSGTLEQETVATYASDDLVVLVTIERMHGEVADIPEQDWTLRVTQVFRKNGKDWELVHRHADPLGPGIRVAQAAMLAKGGPK